MSVEHVNVIMEILIIFCMITVCFKIWQNFMWFRSPRSIVLFLWVMCLFSKLNVSWLSKQWQIQDTEKLLEREVNYFALILPLVPLSAAVFPCISLERTQKLLRCLWNQVKQEEKLKIAVWTLLLEMLNFLNTTNRLKVLIRATPLPSFVCTDCC